MDTSARQLLQELRDDHRNMAIVLDILADAAETTKSDNNPDLELLDEIMRYMTVYPDAVHHPKEDILYAELLAQRPQLAAEMADVAVDHQDIAALGVALRDDVEAIIAGAAVRREVFVVDCDNYVRRLRGHMQWEEEELFRTAAEILEDESELAGIEPFAHIKDPVFELEIESAFRRLICTLNAN